LPDSFLALASIFSEQLAGNLIARTLAGADDAKERQWARGRSNPIVGGASADAGSAAALRLKIGGVAKKMAMGGSQPPAPSTPLAPASPQHS